MLNFARGLIIALCVGGTIGAVQAQDERHVVLITIDGFPAEMFANPKTHIPRIRQLASQGVTAEGMRVSTPSVTWPNHTTLVTGVHPAKHSVFYNGILTRRGPDEPVSVDPRRDKSDLVAVPTIYDLLHGGGLRTAAINWPCTRGAMTLDDDFPDTPESLRYTTPRIREEMVAEGILPNETDASFRAMSSPARDFVWTRAAASVIAKRKPHLLLFHLLNTDGTHHRYGSDSSASHTALALADIYVERILYALDAAGLRSTVIITSDHGFITVSKTIHPNVLLRHAGLLDLNASGQISRARVQVVSEGGLGMVYLNNPGRREQDRKNVLELFRGQEGVERVIEPADFAALGLPSPENDREMADLVLAAKDGYGISGSPAGDEFVVPVGPQSNRGYHGYVASNPKMNAVFIAAGDGIKRGARIGIVNNIDIAPTIAHLLGHKLPNADGKVLTEILEPAP